LKYTIIHVFLVKPEIGYKEKKLKLYTHARVRSRAPLYRADF